MPAGLIGGPGVASSSQGAPVDTGAIVQWTNNTSANVDTVWGYLGTLYVRRSTGTDATFTRANWTALGIDPTNAATLAQAAQAPAQEPVPVIGRGSPAVGTSSHAARSDAQLLAPGLWSPWGSGYDGNVTLDGTTTLSGISTIPGTTVYGTQNIAPSANTYTLPRSMFFNNLTINSGVTLVVPGGCVLYVAGTLTNNGTVTSSGGNASGATAGAAAAAAANAVFGIAAAGGAGATGNGASVAGTLSSFWVAGPGGNGGAGSSGSGGSGSGGQGWNSSAGIAAQFGAQLLLFTGGVISTVNSRPLGGASGGGGGGGDGTNSGGGAGGGGALLIVNARILINNGTIKSNGGNGAAGVAGNSGGGGGGGGGGVFLNTTSFAGNAATSNGGTGGAGAGTGSAGSAGNAGPVIQTTW